MNQTNATEQQFFMINIALDDI